jgi:hypothetical protein
MKTKTITKIVYTSIIASCLFLLCNIPYWADSYFRSVVTTIIAGQIEERRGEIDTQMQKNIQDALHNEETQEQIQGILRQAVAAELEENGESHLRRVIERRAPHAIPLLFPNSTANRDSSATSGG